jgi:uncharacterized membrane protein required for colicin V production
MDWSLLIFVVVILLFAWRGFRSGFVAALGRVLAVIAGYAAAILGGGPLAAWIETQFGLQGLVALGTASLSLFLAAGLIVMLIFFLLRRHVFPDDEVSTASAIGGGFVGALVGMLLAVAIVWTFAFARDMMAIEAIAADVPASSSGVEKLANRLAGSAVSAAMDAGSMQPEVVRLGEALASAPSEVIQRAQRLTTSDEFHALMQDPRNHRVLDSGKPELVQQLPAFKALVANPDVIALTEIAGYGESDDIEAELARQLTSTWTRAQQVKNDPRVQEILADPEFRATLDSGNPLALLTSRQLHELADIVFADETTAGEAPVSDTGGSVSAEPTEIYQWTDSSGRIHYSDKNPAE